MIGDVIQINHDHIYKANKIYDKIKNKEFGNFVLSIAGESGSGKTEIANLLREHLYKDGITSRIESTDDYYKTHPKDRKKLRESTGIIGIMELNLERLNAVVYSYKSDYPVHKEVHSYVYNRFTEDYEYIKWRSDSVDVLIIEGLYSLYVNDMDFGVFLQASTEQTQRFRMKRGKEDTQDSFRQRVLLKESEDIIKSKVKAKFILDYDGSIIKNG